MATSGSWTHNAPTLTATQEANQMNTETQITSAQAAFAVVRAAMCGKAGTVKMSGAAFKRAVSDVASIACVEEDVAMAAVRAAESDAWKLAVVTHNAHGAIVSIRAKVGGRGFDSTQVRREELTNVQKSAQAAKAAANKLAARAKRDEAAEELTVALARARELGRLEGYATAKAEAKAEAKAKAEAEAEAVAEAVAA